MQKKKERDSLRIISLKRLSPVEGAVTYSPAFAVPSAWQGLTSLFGMGRGGEMCIRDRLNTSERPIANKYCEGKVKRTSNRGVK